MNERWKFGTVVRVDPAKNPQVLQPDDRRWMVVSVARIDRAAPWTLLYFGPGPGGYPDTMAGELSHWSSVTGFAQVEDDEDDEHRPYIGEFD